MTTPHSYPQAFWNNQFDNLEEFLGGVVAVQYSNPSYAVRYSWECSCGTWGTARTEDQVVQAIDAHKQHRKEGCGQYKLARLDVNSPRSGRGREATLCQKTVDSDSTW